MALQLAHGHSDDSPLELTFTHAAEYWGGSAVLPFPHERQATIVVRVATFTEQRGECVLSLSP